jgi:hypothetical protein
MMTDQDLDNLYKQNISTSHAAALRGIFDSGYAIGSGGGAPTVDVSLTTSFTTASADDPNITTV